MAQLPLFKSDDQSLMLLQTKWKSLLDPVIKNTLAQGYQLSNVNLVNGPNTINHLLGRMQQGWFFTDTQGVPFVYRSSPFNATNMVLVSSTSITVNIWVY